MTLVVNETVGAATLRIEARGAGYRGALIRKGHPVAPEEDDNLAALHSRLRNEAGKLHPDYIGMHGAIARFRHFFPGDFTDTAYLHDERSYKVKAQTRLDEALPLDRAVSASGRDAVAVRRAFNTNILHSTELARAHEVLGSAEGPAYVQSAAGFTRGEIEAGLAGMAAAIAPHGRSSWPLLTYLPSLWRPEEHMFLKPTATLDFAQRIGHAFQYAYSAQPEASVYRALLGLVADTEAGLVALGPKDRTDVQSFIWVVGDYTDAQLPRLEKLRASG